MHAHALKLQSLRYIQTVDTTASAHDEGIIWFSIVKKYALLLQNFAYRPRNKFMDFVCFSD